MDGYVIEVREEPQVYATTIIADDEGEPFPTVMAANRRLGDWAAFMQRNGWIVSVYVTVGAMLPYCEALKSPARGYPPVWMRAQVVQDRGERALGGPR